MFCVAWYCSSFSSSFISAPIYHECVNNQWEFRSIPEHWLWYTKEQLLLQLVFHRNECSYWASFHQISFVIVPHPCVEYETQLLENNQRSEGKEREKEQKAFKEEIRNSKKKYNTFSFKWIKWRGTTKRAR